jgi:DUF177 domain-containing protein
MQIDIARLRIEDISYEVDLSPEFLVEDIDEPLRFEPARGTVTFHMVGDEVMATGVLTSTVYVQCARCLREVAHAIRAEVHLFYWPKNRQPGRASEVDSEDLDEPDCAYYENEIVQPDDDLREVVVVEAPTFSLCDENCKGLCTHCGADLNDGKCACEPDDEEPETDSGKNAAWMSQLKDLHLDEGE